MSEFVSSCPDLIELLKNRRADIRGGVAAAIGAYSNDESCRRALFASNICTDFLKSVLRSAYDTDLMTARASLSALVNFAADPDSIHAFAEIQVISRMLETLLEKDPSVHQLDSLRVSLITNLTRFPKGVQSTFGSNESRFAKELAEQRIVRLFERMMNEQERGHDGSIDALESVAMFIANLCITEVGRNLVLDGGEAGVLGRSCTLLKSSKNVNRRLGVALMLRNVAVDDSCHDALLGMKMNADSVTQVLCRLVYYSDELPRPIEDEELTNAQEALVSAVKVARTGALSRYESVAEVRIVLAEFLLAMCKTKQGRDGLRERCAYPVLRCAHWIEKNPEAQETLNQVVDRTELADEDNDSADTATAPKISSSQPPPALETEKKPAPEQDKLVSNTASLKVSDTSAATETPAASTSSTSGTEKLLQKQEDTTDESFFDLVD
uniref:Protein HGH1 homolog n=1 Tax=Timspurckia oligopyrenoides TaxID=708627 RepID=A0A7S0ZFW1_9RHOD|mmetsp:Transcript_372/g.673  ORF Transcript_372/g.673 Transcript_372/m.673 type:complete len:440 (+) Transcript_372:30-1349(+)